MRRGQKFYPFEVFQYPRFVRFEEKPDLLQGEISGRSHHRQAGMIDDQAQTLGPCAFSDREEASPSCAPEIQNVPPLLCADRQRANLMDASDQNLLVPSPNIRRNHGTIRRRKYGQKGKSSFGSNRILTALQQPGDVRTVAEDCQ